MRALIASLALSIAAAPLLAQNEADAPKPGKSATDKRADKATDEAAEGWAKAPVEERAVATRHAVTAHGRKLDYTATAGTVTIRDTDGKPTASVFYTAYVLNGTKGDTHRPVTFFWNGGPGSASLWLHMGSFAPVRVQTAGPEYIKPAPYAFGPNPDTLLDKSDLVFLDAVGTGYSRPLGDAKNSDFWGVDQDADAFAKAIMRYATINRRWNSPKFIFGESYGTTRAGAVAYQLQDRGFALNGVILLSSILNYGAEGDGMDLVYVRYLPSYAATAWYHNRVPDRPADVATFVERARAFAAGPYATALAKGTALGAEERDQVAREMSALTGLSVEYLKRANLRVDLNRFQKELMRDRRTTVGRFDSRYTGVDPDAAGESPDYDASDTAISAAFISTLSDYLGGQLNYRTDMPYRISASEVKGFDWDFKHKAPGTNWPQFAPDVGLDLAAAMRTNPYLQLLSLNGYYDMATPFYGTEYDIGHMMLEPAARQNISFRYYPSGHMIYLNPDALHQMHADLAQFYDRAVGVATRARPPARPAMQAGGGGVPAR